MSRIPAVLRFSVACGVVLAVLTTATAARQGPQTRDNAQSTVIQGALVTSLEAAIVKFGNTTLLEYAVLSASRQKRLAPLVLEVARVRRAALKQLIRRDPEAALPLSLTPGQRQGLPSEVLGLLEARLHAVGDLTEALTEVIPPGTKTPPASRLSWTARIGQTTLEAFVYGVRAGHQTKFDTPLHGIAIDGVMAVDDSPLYLYDDFEKWQLGFLPGDIVVTSGGLPMLLPNPQALAGLRLDLLNRIRQFGPYPLIKLIPPGEPNPWTTGVKRILVIQADFSDRTGVMDTEAGIVAAFGEASSFYEDNSRGRTSLAAPTILPTVLHLPSTSAAYAAMGRGSDPIRDDARVAAQAYDATAGGTGMYDPDTYDRFVVLTPQVFSDPRATGDFGGKGVVVTGEPLGFRTLAHELGHTCGFSHSGFWSVPFGSDPLAPGTLFEYGDAWDMMGSPLAETVADPRKTHFNVFFKWLAGWLPSPDHLDVITTRTFRLYRHDAADAAGLQGLRIDAGADKWYWLGIRRQFPSNASMAMGIEVRQVMKSPSDLYGPVELLDMEPMNGGTLDHSLTPFGTLFGLFDDTATGIRIWVMSVGTDSIGEYADVRIER